MFSPFKKYPLSDVLNSISSIYTVTDKGNEYFPRFTFVNEKKLRIYVITCEHVDQNSTDTRISVTRQKTIPPSSTDNSINTIRRSLGRPIASGRILLLLLLFVLGRDMSTRLGTQYWFALLGIIRATRNLIYSLGDCHFETRSFELSFN